MTLNPVLCSTIYDTKQYMSETLFCSLALGKYLILITNFMERDPFSSATSSLARQGTPRILRKVHYRVHTSPPLMSTPSCSVHLRTVLTSFFNLSLDPPSGHFPSGLPTKT
jgi:hypothetical protein